MVEDLGVFKVLTPTRFIRHKFYLNKTILNLARYRGFRTTTHHETWFTLAGVAYDNLDLVSQIEDFLQIEGNQNVDSKRIN